MLVEPGLPAPLYAAAENRRVLALLTERERTGPNSPGDWTGEKADVFAPRSWLEQPLAWRDGCVGDTLELLWAATVRPRRYPRRWRYPHSGWRWSSRRSARSMTLRRVCSPQLTRSPWARPVVGCGPAVFGPHRSRRRPLDARESDGANRGWTCRRARHADRSPRSPTTSWFARPACAASWATPPTSSRRGGPRPRRPSAVRYPYTASGPPFGCAMRRERTSSAMAPEARSTWSLRPLPAPRGTERSRLAGPGRPPRRR